MSRALEVIYLLCGPRGNDGEQMMETDGLLAILVVVALRRVADRPLCWQRGYTDPFLPSLFPFLRTSKWEPQARPMPVSPYQSPPPGAFLEVEGAPAKKKKHHVREQQIPSWRRERATYTASPAARAIDMSFPRPGHVAASTGQPFVPRGVRGIHALVRLRVLRRRGRAGHVVCHRRGAENGGAYGLDDIAAHQQLLCADHDGVPSHRRRSRQPNEMQSRRRR